MWNMSDSEYKSFMAKMAKLHNWTQSEFKEYMRSNDLRCAVDCAWKEGKMEGRMGKSKEFAVKLLQRKTPINDVISLTDLTKEQVEELLEQD